MILGPSRDEGKSLKRTLNLRDLILFGIIVIQPTAPMPLFGIVSQQAKGHVITAVLLAMIAMLLTATSYGRMASAYPSAGSAYAYVRGVFGHSAGFLVGWGIVLDYLLNPLVCVIWCAKAASNFLPMPYYVWASFFALLFTTLNLRGIQSSAKINKWLALSMFIVVIYTLTCMVRFLHHSSGHSLFSVAPFYDPSTFSIRAMSMGTALAAFTYIGFDSISTLAEEAIDPRRDILRATVLTCLVTGILAAAEVYVAQLVWPDFRNYPNIETAYSFVAGRAGGLLLFRIVNATLLIATIGSGMGSQIACARVLYGMGSSEALPRKPFAHLDPITQVPNYNILISGIVALGGALVLNYTLGAELLNFGAFLAFSSVNAATFQHYFVKGVNRQWTYLVLPLLGCIVCLYIWFSLSWLAQVVGGGWLTVGLIYHLLRTRMNKARLSTRHDLAKAEGAHMR